MHRSPSKALNPSLFLERCDVVAQDVDAVRFSLAVAVQFIVTLEMREGIAKPKSKEERPLDTSICRFPPPKGFEYNGQVCYSSRRW